MPGLHRRGSRTAGAPQTPREREREALLASVARLLGSARAGRGDAAEASLPFGLATQALHQCEA